MENTKVDNDNLNDADELGALEVDNAFEIPGADAAGAEGGDDDLLSHVDSDEDGGDEDIDIDIDTPGTDANQGDGAGGDSEDDDQGSGDNLSPEAEFFSGVTDVLKNKSIFTTEVGDVKSEEDFINLIEKEIQERLGEKQRKIAEYMSSNVPSDKVVKLTTVIENLNNITEDRLAQDADLAKKLIIEDLVGIKGMSVEDSEEFYETLEAAGKTASVAYKATQTRINHFQTQLDNEKLEAEQSVAKNKLAIKENQEKLEKALDAATVLGRNVSEASRTKLKNLVTTEVDRAEDGTSLNAIMKYKRDNPVDFEHKLAYLFMATNGFKDLKAFERSARTAVNKNFRSALQHMKGDSPIVRGKMSGSQQNVKIDIDTIDDIVM